MTTKITEPQNAEDVLVPNVENKTWTIGLPPHEVSYVQRPLSFFQKLELFSVLGSAMDQAMSGPNGLSLSDIFDESASDRNFGDADTLVKAVVKLVQYAPDLLSNIYLIALGVPRGERAIVTEMMMEPKAEGGLSDEDGFGILETFIDQNWDVMVDFFTTKILPLFTKISNKVQESQPSKPSKNTPRTTQRQ